MHVSIVCLVPRCERKFIKEHARLFNGKKKIKYRKSELYRWQRSHRWRQFNQWSIKDEISKQLQNTFKNTSENRWTAQIHRNGEAKSISSKYTASHTDSGFGQPTVSLMNTQRRKKSTEMLAFLTVAIIYFQRKMRFTLISFLVLGRSAALHHE